MKTIIEIEKDICVTEDIIRTFFLQRKTSHQRENSLLILSKLIPKLRELKLTLKTLKTNNINPKQ